jgi:hypothetical protein
MWLWNGKNFAPRWLTERSDTAQLTSTQGGGISLQGVEAGVDTLRGAHALGKGAI